MITSFEEEVLEDFFESGNFILNPGRLSYEDEHPFFFRKNSGISFHFELPQLLVFTVVDFDGEQYIDEGFITKNAIGYFFAYEHDGLGPSGTIKYN